LENSNFIVARVVDAMNITTVAESARNALKDVHRVGIPQME